MKIVGIGVPADTRCWCKSGPVIPGIWTSAMRQAVRLTRWDFRKLSADEKTWTLNPSDRIRTSRASRIASSSSMIEIRTVFDKAWRPRRLEGQHSPSFYSTIAAVAIVLWYSAAAPSV